ncbi:MAG: hypothetical protein C0631_03795 [Sedimenticola sp.]|nr:MAG: hypothetical protein C0631_03795 [Sedimenticola sp.]
MKESLKKISERIPYSLGRIIAKVPMHYRLGNEYKVYSKKIEMEDSRLRQEQLKQLNKLVEHAYYCIPFYRKFYDSVKFKPFTIKSFSHVQKIPIVTKKDLQKYSLSDRSNKSFALKESNTGGTTGQPLNFYLEKTAYAREWAHMHAIWARLGYVYTDEKITVRGKNIGSSYYRYNFNQNEFMINAYSPLRENIDTLYALVKGHNIKWIHGYPSSVFSFLHELESIDIVVFKTLINKVQGVFLGSEYPALHYRDYIEKHCGLRTISWYGHSEMAVLAAERDPGTGVYFPFHSYGYAEAVRNCDRYGLVATSLFNYATPLIRYETGDYIDPFFTADNLLESFRIKEGRNSDNVVDSNGRNIALTGLIFGRHHKAFEHAEHIQVKQLDPGKIEILITSQQDKVNWAELFDFTNASFEVVYTRIKSPIKTKLGKIPLLLRS